LATPSLGPSRTGAVGRRSSIRRGPTTTRASAAAGDSNGSNNNNNKKRAPAVASASASAAWSAPVADAPAAAVPPFLLRPENAGAGGAGYDGPVFIDRDGVAIRVMPWDYGFRSGAARTGGVIGATGPSLSDGGGGGGGSSSPPLLNLRSPTRVSSAASSPMATWDEDAGGGPSNGNAAAAALGALNKAAGAAAAGPQAQQQQKNSQPPPAYQPQPSGVAGRVPASLGAVARANFRAELFALRASFRRDEFRAVSDAARPTAGPLRRLAAAAGGAAVGALAAADRALEAGGVLPRLELGPRTTVGAGARSAAMASSSSASSDADECAVPAGDSDAAAAAAAAIACEQAAAELDAPWRAALAALDELTLDDASVAAREPARARAAPEGADPAPWPVRLPFAALCLLLDALYAGRPLQRFWVLETVARVPYFAYISVLHLYESVGLWRAGAELRRVHFAEEYNELHHLQIMVSFGFGFWFLVFGRSGGWERAGGGQAGRSRCSGDDARGTRDTERGGDARNSHDSHPASFPLSSQEAHKQKHTKTKQKNTKKQKNKKTIKQESLGGDRLWVDRFVAEHSAVLYYWLLVALYALAPRSAYRFSELVEVHAYDSYDRFARENAEKLKALPPPLVAARYYRSSETLYMFDGFQDACGDRERLAAEAMLLAGAEACGGASASEGGRSSLTVGLAGRAGGAGAGGGGPRPPRRPPCDTLYDVFINIRDDEAEHVVTMKACADDAVPDL